MRERRGSDGKEGAGERRLSEEERKALGEKAIEAKEGSYCELRFLCLLVI